MSDKAIIILAAWAVLAVSAFALWIDYNFNIPY